MAGWSSMRVACSCSATLAPTTRDPVGPGRVAGVGQPPGSQAGPGRPATGPGDAAFTGSWNSVWATGSLTGTERTRSPPQVDVGERAAGHDAVEPGDAGLGVPRQDAPAARPSGAGGLGRDDDVGGGEGVEAPDDLVAGRLRQAQRGHQGGDAEHRSQRGQHRPARPGRRGWPAPRRQGHGVRDGVVRSLMCGTGSTSTSSAVDDTDPPVGPGRDVLVVGDDDQRQPALRPAARGCRGRWPRSSSRGSRSARRTAAGSVRPSAPGRSPPAGAARPTAGWAGSRPGRRARPGPAPRSARSRRPRRGAPT